MMGIRLGPFGGVRWSTPHALADTLANLDRHRTATVETLADIDDGAALRRHRRRIRHQ
jgi:hypothetical protein